MLHHIAQRLRLAVTRAAESGPVVAALLAALYGESRLDFAPPFMPVAMP